MTFWEAVVVSIVGVAIVIAIFGTFLWNKARKRE